MITAILLDLGRVIVPFDFSIGYRALEDRCGVPVETIRQRIRATGLVPQLETGLVDSRDFVEKLTQLIEIPISYLDFCEIWSSIFARETLIPDSFLEALHRRYPLILVSNTNAIHFEMIRENYTFLRHFDKLILSYEVKAMKPSPAIYEAAVAAAGHPAAECFFTDDIQDYVDAACSFGIDAVHFQGFDKLQNDLAARGVIT